MKTALLAALLALASACSSPDAADDVATPDAAVDTAPPHNPACAPCPGLVGTALRISSLYVTEPDSPDSTADDAIRDFLNEMWKRDMDMGLINMIMVIRGYDPAAGVLDVEQGPAWKHADGNYHFICGYSWTFSAPFDADRCQYDSASSPSTVAFHAGPGDQPTTCAPDGDPSDSITLTNAVTTGAISVDCAARSITFSDGTLGGWMHVTDANGVCACMSFDADAGAYTCSRTPAPDAPGNFCTKRCGKGFALLGYVFQNVAKITPVPGPDGVDSFPLGGTFQAETIGNFADQCCRGENDCE